MSENEDRKHWWDGLFEHSLKPLKGDLAALRKEVDSLQADMKVLVQNQQEVKKQILDSATNLSYSMKEMPRKLKELCDDEGNFGAKYPFLLACIQRILGYAGRGARLRTDKEIVESLREDAETLQYELERNEITVEFDRPNGGNGRFDIVRDAGATSLDGVVEYPVLSCRGKVIRRGKLLLPPVGTVDGKAADASR